MHDPSLSPRLHKEVFLAVEKAQPRVKMTLEKAKRKVSRAGGEGGRKNAFLCFPPATRHEGLRKSLRSVTGSVSMKPLAGKPSLRTAGSCNRDIFLSLWSLKVKKIFYLRKQKQRDTKAHEESTSCLSPGPGRLIPIRIHAPLGTHPAFSHLPGLRAHLQGSQMPTQGSRRGLPISFHLPPSPLPVLPAP